MLKLCWCVMVQMTVGDLKAELLLELDVPLPLQRLLLKGKPLGDDTKLLREYGIVDGSNLTLQVKKEAKTKGGGGMERAKSAPVRAPPVGEAEPAGEIRRGALLEVHKIIPVLVPAPSSDKNIISVNVEEEDGGNVFNHKTGRQIGAD